jgi:hypothetical protein
VETVDIFPSASGHIMTQTRYLTNLRSNFAKRQIFNSMSERECTIDLSGVRDRIQSSKSLGWQTFAGQRSFIHSVNHSL